MAAWSLVRRLGEGGTGSVWLAKTPEGTSVALKSLSHDQAADISSFKQEAQLLVRLQHPSLVSVLGFREKSHDIFGEERGPCYWMEWVEGRPLLEASREAAPAAVLGWFREALEAVSYLESQNIVHGDLSPNNLQIDSQGRLKILDFGEAAFGGQPANNSKATLDYMAPERIDGKLHPACDVFSLGTLFYEALSGRHPRAEAKNLLQRMLMEPTPLANAAPDRVSRHPLEARVIDRMIAADLDRRFQNASSALSALLGNRAEEKKSTAPYHSASFLGADAHWHEIQKSLRNLRKRSEIFFVHGMTGVGKSRFLREASFLASVNGVEVHEIPIEGFRIAEIPPGLVILRELENTSIEMLSALMNLRKRGLPAMGHLLLLEWNDDGLNSEKTGLLQDLLEWPESHNVPLAPLSRKHVEEMLRNALGADFRSPVVTPVMERTGGIPRAVLETIDLLRLQGTPDPSALPDASSLLTARLNSLNPEQRRILQVLALTNRPASQSRLGFVTKTGDSAILAGALRELLNRDLLAKDPGNDYRLSFEALRAEIVKRISNDDRNEYHRLWLTSLSDRPYPDAQRLHHAVSLSEGNEVRQGLLPTIEQLSLSGHKEDALVLLRRGKSVLGDRALLSRALRAEINLLNDLGRYEEALDVCEEWILLNADDESPDLRKVKYWLVSGTNHQNLGRYEEAERRFRHCRDEAVRWGAPEGRPFLVRAHTLLGTEAVRRGNNDEAMAQYNRALELADPQGRRRAEILRHLSKANSQAGHWEEALSLLEESRKIYREDHFTDGEFATLLQEGILALDHGEPERAERAYREAEAIADGNDNHLLSASVWHNRSVLERKRGRLAEALKDSQESQRLFRVLDGRRDYAESLRQGAVLEASLGRFQRAEQELDALRSLSDKVAGTETMLQDAEARVRELRDGIQAPIIEEIPARKTWQTHWNRELVLRALKEKGDPKETALLLQEFYRLLPAELQVSFLQRHDAQSWLSKPKTETLMETRPDIAKNLVELSRFLASKDDMSHLLKRLMDAALEITQTENGFLLLEDKEAADGPIPGFVVAAARNIRREDLSHLEYALSLSAVRDALMTGQPVVTDNASEDPRYRSAKSVQLSGLKSILALPIQGPKGAQGVFYLDHRFRQGLFGDDILKWMEVFAAIAAVALQKARMIEDLKDQIKVQVSDNKTMKRELEEARRLLINRYNDIIGRSPKMVEVLSLVDRITDSKVPVWIYGESGTGKESIARSLHFNSGRRAKVFVTENCSALPEALLESELFGHKKGSFTHATADKKGILQYADGGTIFLDEIADMSLNLQAKLLRFLQEGEIRPIGSNSIVKVDVRVVSASNKDLARLVAEGKFREDLFYRLNGVTVALPPLRERLEDLPLLADHFLKLIADREKKPQVAISPQAMELFLKYSWPGNVRELQNTLETAALFAENGAIHPRSLKFKTALSADAAAKPVAEPLKPADQAEPKLIEVLTAIRDHCFHKGDAAKALGISRRNLYTRLARYGIASDLKTIKLAIDKYLSPR